MPLHGLRSGLRQDFVFDPRQDHYRCPGGKTLMQHRRNFTRPRSGVTKANLRLYRASQSDCQGCALKERCCPGQPMRKVSRDINEAARDHTRSLMETKAYRISRAERKKIETLFGEAKSLLSMDRLRLRGLSGAHDEFLLTATVQNLMRLANRTAIPPPSPAAA